MLDFVSRTPVHRQVTDALRQMLRRGAYVQGEVMPTSSELAVAMAVNPKAVQEAYETLAAEGYLSLEQGKAEVLKFPDETEQLLEHWNKTTVQLLRMGFPKNQLEQRLKEARV